jgi:hypothetical protein
MRINMLLITTEYINVVERDGDTILERERETRRI